MCTRPMNPCALIGMDDPMHFWPRDRKVIPGVIVSMSLLTHRYRAVIVLITFVCLTSISSNYIIINFTFICMQQEHGNTTTASHVYSPIEKSYIMWAVAVGCLLATFPFNYFYTTYGARYPFFVAGMISVFSTALMPLAADYGLYYLLFLRLLQGVAYSADFSAIGLVCVRWAPLRETSLFIALLTMFTIVASSLTNSISGFLCESRFGWRSAFYLHAAFGLIVFLLWLKLYSDEPGQSNRVSEKELRVIGKGKSEQHKEGTKTIPYKALLSHPAILCVWFSAFVEMSSYILLSTYAPIYFNNVLHYEIGDTGVVVGLATVSQIPIKVAAALISDKVSYFSEMAKIHFFNSLAMGGIGLLFACLGFVPASSAWLAVLIYTLINWCFSVNCAGFYKCATLVSRQYAHVVIGTIQWMKCVALFTAPALVGCLVTDEGDRHQWRMVFLTGAALMLLANALAFPIFTVEPAAFTTEHN